MNTDELKAAIYRQIHAVPEGKVATYGDIAKAVGYPSHSRFVGQVLKQLPKGSKIPWHRIINGQGHISFPKDTSPYMEQRQRLMAEGVVFSGDRIPLKTYRHD